MNHDTYTSLLKQRSDFLVVIQYFLAAWQLDTALGIIFESFSSLVVDSLWLFIDAIFQCSFQEPQRRGNIDPRIWDRILGIQLWLLTCQVETQTKTGVFYSRLASILFMGRSWVLIMIKLNSILLIGRCLVVMRANTGCNEKNGPPPILIYPLLAHFPMALLKFLVK